MNGDRERIEKQSATRAHGVQTWSRSAEAFSEPQEGELTVRRTSQAFVVARDASEPGDRWEKSAR